MNSFHNLVKMRFKVAVISDESVVLCFWLEKDIIVVGEGQKSEMNHDRWREDRKPSCFFTANSNPAGQLSEHNGLSRHRKAPSTDRPPR